MPNEPTPNNVSVKALILLASRPTTVQVAVEKLSPQVVGVITSQEILIPVAGKCSELKKGGVDFRFRLVNAPMEISDAFAMFEHLLSELEGMGYMLDDILLDATGGTTPMRLGTALGAMRHGVRMVHQRVPLRYVGGEQWVRDESKEIEIFPMANPLEETGLLREGQAIELFNKRDYPAAALVFKDVVQKVTGVERSLYYRGLLSLSEGYAAWDVADYGSALAKLQDALRALGMDFTDRFVAERSTLLVERIKLNLSFLGNVRGKHLCIENVVDMLENARRRIVDQARYDDGVARLYRSVEMWHQWRLSENHSVETSGVDWQKLDRRTREKYMKVTGLNELPEVLELVKARTLDKILDGGELQDDDVLRDLLQKRNKSILAHGLDPISEKSAMRFLDYVDEMVQTLEIREKAEHARLREL